MPPNPSGNSGVRCGAPVCPVKVSVMAYGAPQERYVRTTERGSLFRAGRGGLPRTTMVEWGVTNG